ncbi:grpE protein homolog 1, mitochondrial-like [Limulus polyphemus]|uniref:GrpE protein homolog n=1 Tax=Limulus polyphemus TaxID=6850 RepID=A0ABM1BRT8_LIMPO|nr:grpE protein homolog 1, mitochondrial-like [Limulus polyphemus]
MAATISSYVSLARRFCSLAPRFSRNILCDSSRSSSVRVCSTTASSGKTSPKEKPPEGGDPAEGNQHAAEAPVNPLEEENKNLIEKIKEIDDKYKRALAENENVRQRMRKQIDEAKQFGIQNFCKDLLDVADVLSKAVESVPQDSLTNENPNLKSLYEGLKMTEAQLQSVFKRHGLNQINPQGQKFNPNQHEALFQQHDPSKEPGTVFIVTKIGYKLHERTIRPALVGVVQGPA